MKNRIFRYISLLSAIAIALSCLTFGSAESEDNTGKTAAMYAYTLNDYIFTLAKKQIQLAFIQSQKEIDDLHQRTCEGS